RGAMEAFLSRIPGDVIVVFDEAYAEMASAPDYGSALPLLSRHPNLVITRTFSKAYGLAGLRVGYLMAAPGLVAVMERVRESFNVNGPALAACEAVLDDATHLQWSVDRNVTERAWLTEALQQRNLRVFPSQTNFVLVEFGPNTALIEAALTAQGVVLRPMGGYGLGDCLRITVGSHEENLRLLAALDQVIA
ncbi:MAG TPA: aminotransferase class I/II-fold pyridoxal phosphate-dependent enzyme, partial [Lysobacter sp.]